MLKLRVVRKSNTRTYTPPEQINVEPSIAMVKDLLDEDLDGHVISFLGETANIARPDTKTRRPVVGMPVISVKIGDHCYHGLCDMGASASAIPYSLYQEVMHDMHLLRWKILMSQLNFPIEILFHQW